MANNFRVSGDKFTSKDGSDANNGTTPDLSNKTISGLFADLLAQEKGVVGAGVYKEAVAVTVGDNIAATELINDGMVVFKGDGANAFFWSAASIQTKITGIVLENYNLITLAGAGGNGALFLDTCIIKSDLDYSQNGIFGDNIIKSVFVNQSTTNTKNNTVSLYDKCTLVNSIHDWLRGFKNGDIDASSSINFRTFVPSSTQFTNCNIRGLVIMSGVQYELKQEKDGTPIDPNPGILDLITVIPDIYTTRACFSEDPSYTNLSKEDFSSLNTGSTNLRAADDGLSNIGAETLFAVVRTATQASPNDELSAATITPNPGSLILSLGDFVLDVDTDGTATTKPLLFGTTKELIGRMLFALALNFDSDVALGNAENDNVLAITNFAGGTAGANPRRLTYQMRWSTQVSEPVLDAEWDNDGFVTAGNYTDFEFGNMLGTEPLIDTSSLGNGDPGFNPVVSGNIAGTWVQFKLKLINGFG